MATLPAIIQKLEELAPLGLAESWDNVGLLVEPTDTPTVERVLVTIDLSAAVLAEARHHAAKLVVAYHPPIFGGLKRLRRDVPSEQLVMDAVRHGICVYSPHTALDAAPNGMNDWLVGALGAGSTRPIVPVPNLPQAGMGRFRELSQPVTLSEAIVRIKAHLGLEVLRVASCPRHEEGCPLSTLAVCAGAGGSVFEKLPHADLLLTGEMRHHDILSRLARGTSVIVTDHTNTERGFLPVLTAWLAGQFPDTEFRISLEDREPLRAV